MSRYEAYSQIFDIPENILQFLYEVFDLYEIRGRVGNVDGIIFEVRSKEANHTIPHIHAAYGEFQISISILEGRILGGNLPKKQQKIAVEWVKVHRDFLLDKWSNLTLKKEMPFFKSGLEEISFKNYY